MCRQTRHAIPSTHGTYPTQIQSQENLQTIDKLTQDITWSSHGLHKHFTWKLHWTNIHWNTSSNRHHMSDKQDIGYQAHMGLIQQNTVAGKPPNNKGTDTRASNQHNQIILIQ